MSDATNPPTGAISVVMPAFNEAATISAVLDQVLAQTSVAEVLVVDDGSTDGTWQELRKRADYDPRIRPFRHDHNRGKGAALRTAFPHVRAGIVIIQDADLEYDPACYDALIEPILADRADVVFGSRFASQGPHRVLYFWHSLGNRFLTLLSNLATDLNLTDMETGFKVLRTLRYRTHRRDQATHSKESSAIAATTSHFHGTRPSCPKLRPSPPPIAAPRTSDSPPAGFTASQRPSPPA